jgi:hypothetical protein
VDDLSDAAGSAALAGCGQGDDAPEGDAERARLRALARGWLRADLDAWERLARNDARAARGALRRWRAGDDLAGVRDNDSQELLPAAERAAWCKLWADVDALLQKAAPPK